VAMVEDGEEIDLSTQPFPFLSFLPFALSSTGNFIIPLDVFSQKWKNKGRLWQLFSRI